jgi:L-threonylcarbamoyladenylate synthase
MASIGKDISLAARLLGEGRLVAIPTETVYGLAANALNEVAVLGIFKAKNRPKFDPLIVHVASAEHVNNLVKSIPDQLEKLMIDLWPGPLTLLFDKKEIVPDLVTSGLSRVAVRMPRHPITQQLLQELSFPLAAPSANPFGYVSPTDASHVEAQLGDKIDYILDGGPADIGIESTIIGMENDLITVYRFGGTPVEKLEEYGEVSIAPNLSSNPQAPGMLKSHYAPGKPLMVGDLDELTERHHGKKYGIISFCKKYEGVDHQITLSQDGHLDEAARNIFGALRKMDVEDIEVVFAELLPEEGLGRAINDRLRRASVR